MQSLGYKTDNASTFLVEDVHRLGYGAEGAANDSVSGNETGPGEEMFIVQKYAVPVVFAIIFIIGIIGNGTLIFTVVRNKNMRNTPNIFIVSLAVGDLLLILVSVPFTSTYYTLDSWIYGHAMCKVNEFLQSLSLGVSVFTLTALSGERFVAISYPMRLAKGSSIVRTLIATGFIWILSVGLASLDGIAARTEPTGAHDGEVCVTHPSTWPRWYSQFHVIFRFLVYFAIPMQIIATFYILMARILIISSQHMPGEGQAARQMRARKKVAKVVLSFVIVFAICWLPRYIYSFWYEFDPSNYNMFWHVFKITGFCLSFINSCVNPLALYFLSKQFRKYYNRYLFCCCTGARGKGEAAVYGDHSETRTMLYNFNSTVGGKSRHQTSMTMVTSQTAC